MSAKKFKNNRSNITKIFKTFSNFLLSLNLKNYSSTNFFFLITLRAR
jgi:hypothetical protein